MSKAIQSLRGMHDILPSQSAAWQHLEGHIRDIMRGHAYREMRTPIVEQTALFCRSIGEVTDIVEKEMYSFEDRNGESISLRPENTAGCIRAALQHGLLQPGAISRVWYQGPMFRYERPQKGRYRQFHQIGAEVYGAAGPAVEAELILMSFELWQRLGLDADMHLEINTLGTAEERAAYRAGLVAYFERHYDLLDEDSRRRLSSNPLRILDSKNPAMQEMLNAAPVLTDSLGEESRAHFAELQRILAAFPIDVRVNPRLVRGLDYYSHTVFEWVTDQLGAQGTTCAGGRYDTLTEQLGGKLTPAVGWAIGAERILALLEAAGKLPAVPEADVYVIIAPDVPAAEGLALAADVRRALPGRAVMANVAGGSLKSQFKKADKSGAALAVILGAGELQDGQVTVKDLRRTGEQQTIERGALAELLGGLSPASTH
ncbi:histidine--tRNA ligase [Granulosicoccaceae sp. 1_MG-2023]|nr:histidine--tRNA ligase [Granulosicoccaceae sp. 1_MG-2023]